LPQYTQCSTTGVPGGKPDLQTSNFLDPKNKPNPEENL